MIHQLLRKEHNILNNKGFTLIELLLGILIASIIGVVVYQMFWLGLKLDDKSRGIHEHQTGLLMVDQLMSHDVFNAVNLNLKNNYPNKLTFEGFKNEFSLIMPTPTGIVHVRYYSGVLEGDQMPVKASEGEYLLRQEIPLQDWLNDTENAQSQNNIQIIITGLRKETFVCQYAPKLTKEKQELTFVSTWDQPELPVAVKCSMLFNDDHYSRTMILMADIAKP